MKEKAESVDLTFREKKPERKRGRGQERKRAREEMRGRDEMKGRDEERR